MNEPGRVSPQQTLSLTKSGKNGLSKLDNPGLGNLPKVSQTAQVPLSDYCFFLFSFVCFDLRR